MDKQPASRISQHLNTLSRFLLILISPSLLAANDIMLPANHQSVYEIEKFGSLIGEMHNQLSRTEQQITYHSTTRAQGFAALFVSDDLQETSQLDRPFEAPADKLRQQSFRAEREHKDEKNQHIEFNWLAPEQAEINTLYRHQQHQIKADQVVWGRHMLPLLMSADLLKDPKTKQNQYLIADKGKLHHYHYTLLKKETIELAGDKHSTLKFKTWREGSSRISYVWLSSEHYYLPLKIEQYKKDKLHLKLVLSNFTTEVLTGHHD